MNLLLILGEPLSRISAHLGAIEQRERVKILFVIESGGRAQGYSEDYLDELKLVSMARATFFVPPPTHNDHCEIMYD